MNANNECPHDFDRAGLGIGGLSRQIEKPAVLTIKQIKYLRRLEHKATRCRRCGQSDVFDGAMFTTDPSSGLCDDCYG